MSKDAILVDLEPGAVTVSVPWVVGATVKATPGAPVDKAERRARAAERIEAQLAAVEGHVARAIAGGTLTAAAREELEARVGLDRKRASWMRAAVSAKRKDLETRAAALAAALGPEVEFLWLGVPRDRRTDTRLIEALAELSIVRLALSEAED